VREAVLRDHLYTLRFLIDRFTLDNGRAPARLHELVEKGYLGRIPTDPFTGSNPSADGQETKEDAPLSPSQIRQLTDWGLKTCTAARTTFPSKAPPTVVGRAGFRSQDSSFNNRKSGFRIRERTAQTCRFLACLRFGQGAHTSRHDHRDECATRPLHGDAARGMVCVGRRAQTEMPVEGVQE
jgi:hypothetical protein